MYKVNYDTLKRTIVGCIELDEYAIKHNISDKDKDIYIMFDHNYVPNEKSINKNKNIFRQSNSNKKISKKPSKKPRNKSSNKPSKKPSKKSSKKSSKELRNKSSKKISKKISKRVSRRKSSRKPIKESSTVIH